MQNRANVKKIKPYPIEAQLIGPSGTLPGKIQRLVLKGFLIDMQGKLLKVGEVYQTTFEIPVIRYVVQQSVRVIKTYDQANLQERRIDRVAEVHFAALSDEQRKNIHNFLQRIGQEDKS